MPMVASDSKKNNCSSSRHVIKDHEIWSSLIYNTSTRHGRHECDTSDTNATRERHERHECCTSATRTIWVKNFYFGNYTSKNIFSHPYIYYSVWHVKDCKERNNFVQELPFVNASFPWRKTKVHHKNLNF